MRDLRDRLMKHNINNMEQLIDYFLSCYEYTFALNKIKPKKLFLDFAKSLNIDITDSANLERLWYGLELKYNFYQIKNLPYFFAKSSINKTLKEIKTIDIEVLRMCSEYTTELIKNEGLDGLMIRPSILVDYEDDITFCPIRNTKEEFKKFLDKYERYIAISKINKLRLLPLNTTKDYVNDSDYMFEIWALLIQSYFTDNLLPLIEDELDNFSEELETLIPENKTEELKKSEKSNEINRDISDDIINKFMPVAVEDEVMDIDINQSETITLTGDIIGAIFKNKIKEDILINMFEELLLINIETLANILSFHLDIMES